MDNSAKPGSFYDSFIKINESIAGFLDNVYGHSIVWVLIVLLLGTGIVLSLIHISEPTRHLRSSYAVFCLKKKSKYV